MKENERTNKSDWILRLYEEESARLILYGRALGLSQAEAEDALQETFLSLLKLVEPPAQPANYCLRSYRNRALNLKRNLWRKIRHEFESILNYINYHDGNWFEPNLKDEEIENFSELTTKALESLPVKQREVIVLKIWHCLTFEEIGTLLNISPNTAAGRYRYGITKIRKFLTKYEKQYTQPERTRDDVERAATAFSVTGS